MSVEQIESTLLQLSREERRQFARWFYENENQILDPQEDEAISPELKTEIMRRREEALAHPELLEPWGDTTQKLRGQLNESAQQREVLTRLAEIEANPELLEPFEEADVERVFQEAVLARAKQAPARRG